MPTMEEIGSYRVIICTMVNAGRYAVNGGSFYYMSSIVLKLSMAHVDI